MYKKFKQENSTTHKLFNVTILKIIYEPYVKHIYLFGFKLYSKVRFGKFLIDIQNNVSSVSGSINLLQQQQLELLSLKIDCANSITNTHLATFGKYRAKYLGKTIVIVATGPTLNKYQPIADAIHIGVNRVYKRQDIELDHIFIQDKRGLKEDLDAINSYRPDNCIKFYGYNLSYPTFGIPEDELNKAKAKRYFLGYETGSNHFYPDISKCIISEWDSVVFSAVNFALFTMPDKIYLVGCDVSHDGYFDSSVNVLNIKSVLEGWKKIKELQQNHYPNTEIISINPVGLKGMFTDEYR